MRVAVGQFASSVDKASNTKAAQDLVAEGARAGARLVVLPEAAMFPFGGPADELEAAAEPLDGPFATALGAAAATHSVTVVAGMFETVPGERRVHNTVVVVGPDGLRARYRKLHLFDALGWQESEVLRPGGLGEEAFVVVEIDGLRCGLATCYDLRFPELFRALVDRGAEVLVVPSAWVAGPQKERHWSTLLSARAIENTCYVVAAAQSPPTYCGGSSILDPMGTVLAGLGEGDGLAVAELRRERLAEVRAKLPVLDHRRL